VTTPEFGLAAKNNPADDPPGFAVEMSGFVPPVY
jgi:hypothetical protein